MKNLEEEYKNSQQEEMPDLWNRIEAGLTEKKKPIPLLSATRYLGIVAAAAALLLIVSLGLWSGRRSTENNASYMALQNGAASSPYNNSANMSANDEAFLQEAVVEEIGQEPDQNGLSFPSVMEDETEDASLQEIMAESQEISNSQTSVGSMSPENAVAKDETTLSAEDALAHLGAYLEEAGMLPADRELYGTGEGERPGYAWAGVAADDGEPARMFLEFYAYSEDGSYLIFCMGKRASEGDENVLFGEYAVHVLTGAIEEQ